MPPRPGRGSCARECSKQPELLEGRLQELSLALPERRQRQADLLGGEAAQRTNQRMLEHAAPHVQREVAKVLTTRTVPRVRFVYDESIEGSIRVQNIINELRAERDEDDEQD